MEWQLKTEIQIRDYLKSTEGSERKTEERKKHNKSKIGKKKKTFLNTANH